MEKMASFIDKALTIYYKKRTRLKKQLREVEAMIKTLEEVKRGDNDD